MSLSNFGRKKAGAGAGFWEILEAGELGDAPENLNFWKFYDIMKG